jgi:hypothetical protein
MIKSSLILNYGVSVQDMSSRGKPSPVVLIYDFDDPLKLNVCTKAGFRKCIFSLRDLKSDFVYANPQSLTLNISLVKSSFVYKFKSELELEATYSCIIGDHYIYFGTEERLKYSDEHKNKLKADILSWPNTTEQMARCFLLLSKFQLSYGTDIDLASSLPRHQFELLVKSYFRSPDLENFDKYFKRIGLTDKPFYDHQDIITFLLRNELNCEYTDSGFRPDVL